MPGPATTRRGCWWHAWSATVRRSVALIEHEGEPTALLDAWEGARLAIELARALERAADQVLALAAVPG